MVTELLLIEDIGFFLCLELFDLIFLGLVKHLQRIGLPFIEFRANIGNLTEDHEKSRLHNIMRRGNQVNYQAKNQTKQDNRMNKYQQKQALRHEDEATRIHDDRRKQIEREQNAPGALPPLVKDNTKFVLLALLSTVVILFCSYRLLDSRGEAETTKTH